MTENQLVLNQSKTKGLLFGTRQKLGNTDAFVLQLRGKNIERVSKFNYLGTKLDEQLMWKEHIDMVCSKVNKCLGLLSPIRSCLTLKAANCVYRSVIEPVFNYTDTAMPGEQYHIGCSKNLQQLQNRAARITLRRDSSRDTFDILKWTDLEKNRKIHKCVIVFKCLHNLVPPYF